jgi:hypothetical protein
MSSKSETSRRAKLWTSKLNARPLTQASLLDENSPKGGVAALERLLADDRQPRQEVIRATLG